MPAQPPHRIATRTTPSTRHLDGRTHRSCPARPLPGTFARVSVHARHEGSGLYTGAFIYFAV